MTSETRCVHHGGGILSSLRDVFSKVKNGSTNLFYGVVLAFVALTLCLAFAISSTTSSPFFSKIFVLPGASNSTPSSYPYRFPFRRGSSMPSEPRYLPPPMLDFGSWRSNDSKSQPPTSDNRDVLTRNDTLPTSSSRRPDQSPAYNRSVPAAKDWSSTSNVSNTDDIYGLGGPHNLSRSESMSPGKPPSTAENKTQINADKDTKLNQRIPVEGSPASANQSGVSEFNSTFTPHVSQGEDTERTRSREKWLQSLMNCDIFDGRWVADDSYPLYKPGSCSLIEGQFNCFRNGRPDKNFQAYRWKPRGCHLPRLDGAHMLEMLRGKRLAFVGDSLNRNMWESLICILKNSVKNPKNVLEARGRRIFRGDIHYSFVFKDYNCTVELFVSPFLVREWVKGKKRTLRLDLMDRTVEQYNGADIIVFNTGHWWNHEKTFKGRDYYQEGNVVHRELNVQEAFRKALTTWGSWVDANVDPSKTLVFFRGYSIAHFRGGKWNSGGICDNETRPIMDDTKLSPYHPLMKVLETVLEGMRTPVTYLNVTRLTDYRKDGHPSKYRNRNKHSSIQDCSHWCLPGVPDLWNEILYAQLLLKLHPLSQSHTNER